MFKKLLIVTILIFLHQNALVLAASPTLTPLPVSSETKEKAKELKEKVASKIAELKLLQKRAFMGTIKSFGDAYLILTSHNKDIKVEVDKDTKIILSTPGKGRKTVKLEELSKDQKLVAWGQFNKEIEVLTAKTILVRSFSLNLKGIVKSLDKNELTLTEKDNKDYTVSLSQANIRILKKDKSKAKALAEEISEGDYIHVYATPKISGEKTTYTALRVLVLPKSIVSELTKPKPTASPKPSPSPTKSPTP